MRGAQVRKWLFLAAAGVPCVVMLVLCGTAIHEWWLISSHQIAVVPRPVRGQTSAPEVPAASLLPLIVGSAALAGLFGYALLRRSRRALIGGYLALLAVIAEPYVGRLL